MQDGSRDPQAVRSELPHLPLQGPKHRALLSEGSLQHDNQAVSNGNCGPLDPGVCKIQFKQV